MTSDVHQRARSLIALGGPQALGADEQRWLDHHLQECESCSAYASNAREMIHALRSLPVAASSSLVSATQFRVRLRAQELRQRRERLWLVWMSCVLVTFSAGFTTIFAWRGWEWIGRQLQVSSLAWQVFFVLLWIAPVLVASLLLMAHGTHLADQSGASQG